MIFERWIGRTHQLIKRRRRTTPEQTKPSSSTTTAAGFDTSSPLLHSNHGAHNVPEKLQPRHNARSLTALRLLLKVALSGVFVLISAVELSRNAASVPKGPLDYSVFLKGTLYREEVTPAIVSAFLRAKNNQLAPLVPGIIAFIRTHPLNIESKWALNILNRNLLWNGRGAETVTVDQAVTLCDPLFTVLNVDEEIKLWLLNMLQRYMEHTGIRDRNMAFNAILEYGPYLLKKGPTEKIKRQVIDSLYTFDSQAEPEMLARIFDVFFGLLNDKSIPHDIRMDLESLLRRSAFQFVVDLRYDHLERQMPAEDIFAKLTRLTGNDPVKLYIFFTDYQLYGMLADEIFGRLQAYAESYGVDLYTYLERLDPLKHFFESFLFSAINFNKSDRWFSNINTLRRSFHYLFNEVSQESLIANAALTQAFVERLITEKGFYMSMLCAQLLLDEYNRSSDDFHKFYIAATIVLHKGWFVSLDDAAVDKIAEENTIDLTRLPSDRIDYSRIFGEQKRPLTSAQVVFVDEDATVYYRSALRMFTIRGYRFLKREEDRAVLEKRGTVTMRVTVAKRTDGTYRFGDGAASDPHLKLIMIRGHQGSERRLFSEGGEQLSPGTHVVLSFCRGMFIASRFRFDYPGTLWIGSRGSVLGYEANAVMISMIEGLRTREPTYSAIKKTASRLSPKVADDFTFPSDAPLLIGRLLREKMQQNS